MNRIRVFFIAAALTLTLSMAAQTTPAKPASGQNGAAAHHMPTVDEHMKVLAEKLDLTADQQAKIRPEIAQMQDEMQSARNDSSLSRDQRTQRTHDAMQNADKKIRTYLNDEQKKKLDDLEQNMHNGQDHAHTPSH